MSLIIPHKILEVRQHGAGVPLFRYRCSCGQVGYAKEEYGPEGIHFLAALHLRTAEIDDPFSEIYDNRKTPPQ